ncbi:unnamed protein product [Linum trigynum]|uniref:Beta-glucosidase 12-like n=1 Tax=Linum trigynum TaxID=586398 RepID=A0AAV2EZJ5_9ROSI
MGLFVISCCLLVVSSLIVIDGARVMINPSARDTTTTINGTSTASSFSRRSFPAGFVFGTASSAYQYEGAAMEGGRTPSIWDNYAHQFANKIADHSNGDVATDSYHRYKEDVKIMKDLGFEAYRLSISWSRILPNGKLSGGVNKEGVKYYNNLFDELLANGIQPFVTIFHWDLPQTLESEYRGFLNPRVVDDFRDYAEVLFKEFGDRVKNWITINEPLSYSAGGYAYGYLAPGRCSSWVPMNCSGGDSATEPYIVGHHILLSHSAAVDLYKQKYQASQKGHIGITLVSPWIIPYTNSTENRNAQARSLDFSLGWFFEPLTSGSYPQSMRTLVGKRLPEFTKQQSKKIRGSFDFIGMNYYTASYAVDTPLFGFAPRSYMTDSLVNTTDNRNGVSIGPKGASSWLNVYPKGIYDILCYIKRKYNDPVIYITENGIDEFNNDKVLPAAESLHDKMRIHYHRRHLYYLQKAIRDGVNVKGYFAWSLLDNYEWTSGYSTRFGLFYVDFKNGLTRYPKQSAKWFKGFLSQ